MFALLLCKCQLSKPKVLWGGDIRGIDRRSFILCYQSSLLFFPPPFTAICLFVVLGMGVHRVFHRFLVCVEEDVLESKRSQDFIFFISCGATAQPRGDSLSGLDIESRVVSVFDETFTINTRVDDIGHTREISFFSIHATLNQLKTGLYRRDGRSPFHFTLLLFRELGE